MYTFSKDVTEIIIKTSISPVVMFFYQNDFVGRGKVVDTYVTYVHVHI